MKYVTICLLIIAGLPVFLTGQESGDLEIIRDRVVAKLLVSPVDGGQVRSVLDEIRTDGSWPDINYVDTTRTGFQHAKHLNRMVLLSRAFTQKSSPYFKSIQVSNALESALNYWLDHDFICENWWWNQIGTPGQMVNVVLLMQDQLSEEQLRGVISIVDRSHLEASGARPSGDRIKMAGILAKKLLAQGDKVGFDEVIRVIEGEIKFSEGRGMQVDYSFHHRVDRVNNTLSYGLGYAQAFGEWAALVAGTSYEFGEPAIRQLVDYFLDGICKMSVHGRYPDLGAKNRSVSRPGAMRSMGTGLIDQLLLATSYRAEELQEIRDIRLGQRKGNRTFHKFFWQTEYASHQRPEYFTSVRMYSTRNQNMESPYNSEGLKNHYLGDGSQFISRTGREYYNIFPVWDWRRIPGTTVVQKPGMPPDNLIRQEGKTAFVGGVSDGKVGAAAFDYVKEMDSLQARKSWFFFDELWVCLGAGIRSTSEFPVNTTLNQTFLQHEVVISRKNSVTSLPDQSHIHSDEIRWVWHDSVGYYFPEGGQVHICNQNQRGSWYEISRQNDSPKDPITEPIFKLWLDHGANPISGTYEYVVFPAVGKAEMQNENLHSAFSILANTDRVQAVRHHTSGIVQAVFYEPGSLEIMDELEIEMKNTGMIMLRLHEGRLRSVTVADPGRELTELRFSFNQPLALKNGENDAVVSRDSVGQNSEIVVKLPGGVWAGSSVVVEFEE